MRIDEIAEKTTEELLFYLFKESRVVHRVVLEMTMKRSRDEHDRMMSWNNAFLGYQKENPNMGKIAREYGFPENGYSPSDLREAKMRGLVASELLTREK